MARAAAIDTPTMALAPSRDLFSVPSRSISARSSSARSAKLRPPIAFGDLAVDIGNGLEHPFAAEAGRVAVAELDRLA